MILGGLGTDTGGSTRGPASFNGHTGMKQTFGRVSKFGCVPLGYSLDHINPMSRSAYDCALMLRIMAGYDPKDPTTVDLPVPDYASMLDGDVKGVRIGLPIPYFFDAPELDAEVKAGVLAAVDVLKSAGAMLRIMAGYDPKDPTTVDLPVPDYASMLAAEEALGVGIDDDGCLARGVEDDGVRGLFADAPCRHV